ncbi:acyl-CoA carboxylase subunit beta [Oceanobacillus kimchii]|uniref:acyl-CoA carboxylase subunit beta n=1 Tax=Oceanobacillus kimchii TaxID=746691 RepID=UPI003B02EC94
MTIIDKEADFIKSKEKLNLENKIDSNKMKLNALERIDMLLDKNSFVELYPLMKNNMSTSNQTSGDGVIVGFGTIEGRIVYIYSQDFKVLGGTVGKTHAEKISKLFDLAGENKYPIIGLFDSGGARIQEGIASLEGYGSIFKRNVIYSGIIPQISVILGPCAGGSVYSPALSDFVFMVENTSHMFITGPKVIKSVTGENVSLEELGGALVHSTMTGNIHFSSKSEREALLKVKELLGYLPSNNENKPLSKEHSNMENLKFNLKNIVPTNNTKSYNIKDVIGEIVDYKSFLEIQKDFAKNIVIGFARIKGQSIGLVCNQPKVLAGSIDINSADKAARFIRFCNSFNIPIITLEDVTGFFPGVEQEHKGIIRHGAKIIYAYAEATVPKITIILRKAYGGAYVALNSKSIGADLVFAWPKAEIAVMGAKAAVKILNNKDIKVSDNPQQLINQKITDYENEFLNPNRAGEFGAIDNIIDPEMTRSMIIKGLELLRSKQEIRPNKKHGNMPL